MYIYVYVKDMPLIRAPTSAICITVFEVSQEKSVVIRRVEYGTRIHTSLLRGVLFGLCLNCRSSTFTKRSLATSAEIEFEGIPRLDGCPLLEQMLPGHSDQHEVVGGNVRSCVRTL